MIKPDLYGEDRAAKRLAQSLSARVLEQMLILLHPVMPFVTEEIWQKLPQTSGSIMKAALPAIEDDRLDPAAEEAMELIMGVVNGIRNIRGEMNVRPATRVGVVCHYEKESDASLLNRHAGTISDLARLSDFAVLKAEGQPKPAQSAGTVVKTVEVFVILKDILDFDSEARRLEKELSRLEKEFGVTQKKLLNEDFL